MLVTMFKNRWIYRLQLITLWQLKLKVMMNITFESVMVNVVTYRCMTVTMSEIQRWRLPNRKWLKLWFGTRYRRDSIG
jgi:hypothetical protein